MRKIQQFVKILQKYRSIFLEASYNYKYKHGAVPVLTGWRKLTRDQVERESTLVNQRLKKNVTANNIVPFARKAAPVAA